MALIPVAEWAPDRPDYANKGSITIRNALPEPASYAPMPSFGALTDSLGARCRGAIDARDKDLNVYQFAGDVDTLYELSSASWGDVSKVGGYSTGTDEVWEFVRWKNRILATNFSDSMQYIELGGTAFADLTTAFRARRLFVVRDHVVAANTFDSTDGNVPDRVRTSAFDDETDWTPDPATGSIARDLKAGPILAGYGGDYGLMFTSNATFRMDWVGAPTWFQINPTLPEVGLIAPRASARIGNTVFAWSNQGMVAITHGTGYEPIGAGRVDSYLFRDLDDGHLHRMSAASDPRTGRIYWAYPGAGNTDGLPNRIAVYDSTHNKWGIIDYEVDLLWQAGGIGYTLDQLDSVSTDLDALPASLDSSRWKGDGVPLFGAFDSTFAHGFFDGSPMTAEIETKEVEIHAGHQTALRACRPMVDGGSYTLQIGHRNSLLNEREYTPVLTPTATGRVTKRVNARYHTFKMEVSGDWNDVLGVQVEPDDARRSGRRGRTD